MLCRLKECFLNWTRSWIYMQWILDKNMICWWKYSLNTCNWSRIDARNNCLVYAGVMEGITISFTELEAGYIQWFLGKHMLHSLKDYFLTWNWLFHQAHFYWSYIHSPHLCSFFLYKTSQQSCFHLSSYFFTYTASTWARCISPVPLLVRQHSIHTSNFY